MPKQSFLIGFSIFLFIGLIAFGIGYWYTKMMRQKSEKEIAAGGVSVKTKTLERKKEDQFDDDSVAAVIEPEKGVLRITARLDENGKCFYKVERAKTSLQKSYPGQPVSIFKNAETWRTDDGIVTTVHDFKKCDSLDNFFISQYATKRRLSLDKSAGRLLMQTGPETWYNGRCSIQYSKKLKLPIEVIAEIDTIEYLSLDDNRFLREVRLRFGEDQSKMNGVAPSTSSKELVVHYTREGILTRLYKNDETNNEFQDILWQKFKNGLGEGTVDIPEINKSSSFAIAITCFIRTEQTTPSDIGFSKIVVKGKYLDNEASTDSLSAK